jgi:hypothetical protein
VRLLAAALAKLRAVFAAVFPQPPDEHSDNWW